MGWIIVAAWGNPVIAPADGFVAKINHDIYYREFHHPEPRARHIDALRTFKQDYGPGGPEESNGET